MGRILHIGAHSFSEILVRSDPNLTPVSPFTSGSRAPISSTGTNAEFAMPIVPTARLWRAA
jgi:hypothetical protein